MKTICFPHVAIVLLVSFLFLFPILLAQQNSSPSPSISAPLPTNSPSITSPNEEIIVANSILLDCTSDFNCSTLPAEIANYTQGFCNFTTNTCDCATIELENATITHYGTNCSSFSITPKNITRNETEDHPVTPPVYCVNNCSLNGICNVTNVTCECYPGYAGLDCSELVCLNNCTTRGTCISIEKGSSFSINKCECSDRFIGEDCSLIDCVGNCTFPAHGYCNTTIGECVCNSTIYFGENCELVHCPNDCYSNFSYGECNNSTGICECSSSRQGEDCSIPYIPCPNDCSGHGSCNTTTGVCTCEEPYQGKSCSKIYCPDISCSGAGVCDFTRGVCVCDSMHSGRDCELILCENNCTQPNGICNLSNGTCNCFDDWSGEDCSINVHLVDLQRITKASQVVGTTFIMASGLAITASAFTNTKFSILGLGGHITTLLDMLQFVGLTGLIGEHVPPLYIKFAASFGWTNFLFNLGLKDAEWTDDKTNPTPGDESDSSDIRKMLGEKGSIVFLDNFVIVCTLVIVTMIMCGGVILIRLIMKQQSNRAANATASLFSQPAQEELESNMKLLDEQKNVLGVAFIRLALVTFSGLSLSIPYELNLAIQGRSIGVSLIVGIALLIGYIAGIPLATFVLLRNGRNQLQLSHFKKQFAPLYTDFKNELYLFILVVMIKKVLIGFSVGLFQMLPQDQLISILIVLVIYLLILVITKPYKDVTKSYMEIIVAALQIATVIFLVLTTTGVITGRSAGAFFAIVIISVYSIMIAICILLIIAKLLCPDALNRTGIAKTKRTSYHGGNFGEEELEHMNKAHHTLLDEDDSDEDVQLDEDFEQKRH